MEIANYMHLEVGEGMVTAAIAISKEDDGKETAHVSVSFCSPNDQFSKKKGRLAAAGRVQKALAGKLSAKKFFQSMPLDPDQQVSTQVRDAIKECVRQKDKRFPSWALAKLR